MTLWTPPPDWIPPPHTAAYTVLSDLTATHAPRRTGARWDQARKRLREAGYITPDGITAAGLDALQRAPMWDGRPSEAPVLLALSRRWQGMRELRDALRLSRFLLAQRLDGLRSLGYAERWPRGSAYAYRATAEEIEMQPGARAYLGER